MTTLPGRGPKSAKEHLADAVRSQSVNSGDGLIRTRPANRGTPSAIPPRPPSAGGVLMQTAFVNIFATSNDPVVWGTGFAGTFDIGPVSDYVDLSSGVLTLLQSGWFEVGADAQLSSATAGAGGELYIGNDGDPLGVLGGGVTHPDGVLRLSARTGLYYFDVDVDDPRIIVGINSHDGSGASTSAVIKIVVLSGVTP